MKLFIVLQAVCLLAVVEAKSHKRGLGNSGVIDQYVSYAYTRDSKENKNMKQCIAKCAANANVSMESVESPKGLLPTKKEFKPACEISPCIEECDKSGYVSVFLEFVCESAEYNNTVGCMNQNFQNASTACLIEHYRQQTPMNDEPEKAEEPTDEDEDEDAETLKAVCKYLKDLHGCIGKKMSGFCGKETAESFGLYSRLLLKMMKCP